MHGATNQHLPPPLPDCAAPGPLHDWGSKSGLRWEMEWSGCAKAGDRSGPRVRGVAHQPLAVPGARAWPGPSARSQGCSGGGEAARRAQAASTNRVRRLV